jgi:hypothetical protein
LEVYMKTPVPMESASRLIDEKIKELGDWRGKTLAKVREIIHEADPEMVEEWKWVKATNPGTPVWSHGGIVCTGETYKNVVKMTFAKGARLKDPSGLFNSSPCLTGLGLPVTVEGCKKVPYDCPTPSTDRAHRQ